MTKEKEYISDDDVVIIGGSDWHPKNNSNRPNRWKIVTFILAGIMILVGLFYIGRHIFHTKEFIQTRNAKDIIAALEKPMEGKAGITYMTEEAMGVKLKIYGLKGLKAHFA